MVCRNEFRGGTRSYTTATRVARRNKQLAREIQYYNSLTQQRLGTNGDRAVMTRYRYPRRGGALRIESAISFDMHWSWRA